MESCTCCHLTEEQLSQIREKLNQLKPDLPVRFIPDQSGHCISDLASDTAAINQATRLADRNRKLFHKICAVEKLIDEGTYGICKNCGEPIDWQRLLAQPTAELCIDCKNEQEELESRIPRDKHWGDPHQR